NVARTLRVRISRGKVPRPGATIRASAHAGSTAQIIEASPRATLRNRIPKPRPYSAGVSDQSQRRRLAAARSADAARAATLGTRPSNVPYPNGVPQIRDDDSGKL